MDGPPKRLMVAASPEKNEALIAERLESRMTAATEAREALRATTARTAASEVARARFLHARARGQDALSTAALAAEIQSKQAASDARRAEVIAARKQKASEGYQALLGTINRAAGSQGQGPGPGRSEASQGQAAGGTSTGTSTDARAGSGMTSSAGQDMTLSPVGAVADALSQSGESYGSGSAGPSAGGRAAGPGFGLGQGLRGWGGRIRGPARAGAGAQGVSSAASHYSSFTAGTRGTQGATLHSRRSDASTLSDGCGVGGVGLEGTGIGASSSLGPGHGVAGGSADAEDEEQGSTVAVNEHDSALAEGLEGSALLVSSAGAVRLRNTQVTLDEGRQGARRGRSLRSPWAADYGHLQEYDGSHGPSSQLGSPSLPSSDEHLLLEASHRDMGGHHHHHHSHHRHHQQGQHEDEAGHVDLGEHREGMLRDGMGRASVERTSHGSGSEHEEEDEGEGDEEGGGARRAHRQDGDGHSADDVGSTAPLPLSPATSARRTVGSVRFELYSGPRDPPAPAPATAGTARGAGTGSGPGAVPTAAAAAHGGSASREGAAVKGILRNSSTSPSLTSSLSGPAPRLSASSARNNHPGPDMGPTRGHARVGRGRDLYLSGGVDEVDAAGMEEGEGEHEEEEEDDLDLDAPSEGLHPPPSARLVHEQGSHTAGAGSLQARQARDASANARSVCAGVMPALDSGVHLHLHLGQSGVGGSDGTGARRAQRSASLAETYTFSSGFQARVLTRSSALHYPPPPMASEGMMTSGGHGAGVGRVGRGASGGQQGQGTGQGAEEEEDEEDEGGVEGAGRASHASVDAHAPEGEEEEQRVGLQDVEEDEEEAQGGAELEQQRVRASLQARRGQMGQEADDGEEEEEDGEGESTSRSAAEVASGVVAVAASHGQSGSSTAGSDYSSSRSDQHIPNSYAASERAQGAVVKLIPPSPVLLPTGAPAPTPAPAHAPSTSALAGQGLARQHTWEGTSTVHSTGPLQPPQSLLERLMRKTPPRAAAAAGLGTGASAGFSSILPQAGLGRAHGYTASVGFRPSTAFPSLGRASTYPLHLPSSAGAGTSHLGASGAGAAPMEDTLPPSPPDFLRRRTGATGLVANLVKGGSSTVVAPMKAGGKGMEPLPVSALAPMPPSPNAVAGLPASHRLTHATPPRPPMSPPQPSAVRSPPSATAPHARARSNSVEERAAAARTKDAQWTSRVVLAAESRKRSARTARVQTAADLRDAERRRMSALQARTGKAQAHDEHVAHVRTRVKAAKRVQRWFRRRRIYQLGNRSRASSASSMPGPGKDSAGTPVCAPAHAGSTGRRALIEHSPIRGPTETSTAAAPPRLPLPPTATSSSSSEGREGDSAPSLSTQLRACAAAVSAVDHTGASKARKGLHAVLCGRPALDDGRSLEAAMRELQEEMSAQGLPLPSPAQSLSPYPSFDACALAIQQRCNIAAAQAVIGQLMTVYQSLEEGGVIAWAAVGSGQAAILHGGGVQGLAGLSPQAGGAGGARTSPFHPVAARHTGFTPVRPTAGHGASAAAAAHASDLSADGNPSLRPALARSARTLLASLLIAYFPAEILSTGGMQDEGAVAVEALRGGTAPGQAGGPAGAATARHGPLIAAAKRLLGHLHAYCDLFSSGPSMAERATLGLEPSDRPDLGLDASVHVLPELRLALQGLRATGGGGVASGGASLGSGGQGDRDTDRSARIVHATLCLLNAWCVYMDCFMAWKHGDGMRAAQALARPYRALLVRRAELTQEANTRIGAGDAGLEQLREGVEGQLVAIRGQLVALLGSAAASRWERDQGASLEAEMQREAMRRAAAQAQAGSTQQQQLGQAAGTSSPCPASSLPGAASRVAAASGVSGFTPSTARNAARGQGTGSGRSSGGAFSPGFLLGGRPPRSPARPAMSGPASTTGGTPVTAASPLPPASSAQTGGSASPAPGLGTSSPAGTPSSPSLGPHVPPGATSSPQAALFRTVMRNEGLAHELMIDPAFRLPDQPAPEGLLDWEAIQDSDFVTEGAPDLGLESTTAADLSPVRAPGPAAPQAHAQAQTPATAHAETGVALASLGRRVSTGEAGLSVGSSPSLASVHAGLALIQQQQAGGTTDVVMVPDGALPPLDLPPTAAAATPPSASARPSQGSNRARLRVRHRGQTRLTPAMAQDPAFLRTNPWFWEAALSAATDAETAASTGAAAATAAGVESPGTAAGTSASSSPAVDLVLAGLESIRESLISLVPHRTDLHADIRAHVDLELFRTMLQNRAFSHTDWIALLRYIGRLISSLEAPARNDETSTWLTGAESFVRTIARRRAEAKAAAGKAVRQGSASPLDAASSGATLDDDLLVLLPRVFAWAHFKTAQIRLDTSNAHLAMLGPYLLEGGRGAEYERSKFESQLAKGAVSTSGVKTWLRLLLSQHVQEASKDARAIQGITDAQAEAAGRIARVALQADYKIGRFCLLRDGLVLLLASPHPLTLVATVASRSADGIARLPDPAAPRAEATSADASSSVASPAPGTLHGPLDGTSNELLSLPFPETFQLDAKRLMDAQNTVQKVALLSALTALIQQLVSSLPAAPAGYACAAPTYPALRVPQAAYKGVGMGTLHSTAASIAALAQAADREEADTAVRSIAGVQGCIASWLGDEGLRLPELQQGLEVAVDTLGRLGGRVPLLLPETENALPEAVVSTVASLRNTLRSAIERCVSTSHPLFSTFSRRVLEGLRHKVTRELQDTLPPSGDTNRAHEFPAWKKFLGAPGAPLPGPLASAFPTGTVPLLMDEVEGIVRMLARLIRHNHAVFEPHYKQWIAEA